MEARRPLAPPENVLREQKQALRQRLRAVLAAIPPERAREGSERIRERALALVEFQQARSLFSYVSQPGEVETHSLIRHALHTGKQVCVPVFDPVLKRYRMSAIADFDRDLRPGHFGILEPIHPIPVNAPAEVAFIPGLAFDPRGHRLGRGKGYYDCLLRDYRGIKVALAFDCQLLEEVPATDRDVPVDIILTESRLLRAGR